MTTTLIRIAMILTMIIGMILTANAAEYDMPLWYALVGIITMFIGMIGTGLSFCVTVRKEARKCR